MRGTKLTAPVAQELRVVARGKVLFEQMDDEFHRLRTAKVCCLLSIVVGSIVVNGPPTIAREEALGDDQIGCARTSLHSLSEIVDSCVFVGLDTLPITIEMIELEIGIGEASLSRGLEIEERLWRYSCSFLFFDLDKSAGIEC